MFLGKSFGGQSRLTVHAWMWGLLCLCATLLFAGARAEAQTVTTYSNSSTASIPDNACPATVDRYFNVGTSYIIGDVNIGVLLDHTYRRDLEISLTSPGGTVVTLMDYVGGSANNLNVEFDDEGNDGSIASHTSNDSLTPVYASSRTPQNSLSAFDGENAFGTWTLRICDQQGIDTGSFRRADLYITQLAPSADLSLTKSFGATSTNTGRYTLSVTNSATSELTATGVTVSDNLPAGVTLTGTSGTGTYSGGIWTLGTAIAPGQTVTIELSVTITASSGTITNTAQIRTSSAYDHDSTPNNGVTSEDDYASVSFTAGGRLPGYVPPLTSVCSTANQIQFSWASPTAWSPSGSLSQTYNVSGLGNILFNVTQPPNGFINGTPEITTSNSGGGASGTRALYFYMNNGNETHSSSTTLTLPVAVPGLQFKIFDIDYAANQFTDRVTVTGTYNGSTVLPTLSNNTANYVSGNSVIGDGASGATDPFGNVVVTFTSPVDSVTIVYGNHLPTTPTSSGNQAMSIHDITFCRPTTTLSVTKISSIISDPVNGSDNPKRIPDAIVQYCILISNSGAATADSIVATDNLSGPFTYNPGTMRSGSNCGSATTVEDDDATGSDESDPYGAYLSGSTITATAASLAPASSFALTFQVTID
ncbi:proprotein convertase P-domain-containing protein [Sphingorhabdus sp. SMR4y]|uniref:proprotein convertase P-domain-containing protein n=1 Tax=Sphingorhabdus sp. SMR4y TaxID=2584094 RepID=UPI0016410F6A|nr:proprotein convertase P-domain-containing protein [Sphingorhabdus sp. SMR4y]